MATFSLDDFKMMPVINVDGISAQAYCRRIATFLRLSPMSWTQGYLARDIEGRPCAPHDGNARALCLLGLLERFVEPAHVRQQVLELLARAVYARVGKPIAVHSYNDNPHRTLGEIISLLEEASRLQLSERYFDYEDFLRTPCPVCLQDEYFKQLCSQMVTSCMKEDKSASIKLPSIKNKFANLLSAVA